MLSSVCHLAAVQSLTACELFRLLMWTIVLASLLFPHHHETISAVSSNDKNLDDILGFTCQGTVSTIIQEQH